MLGKAGSLGAVEALLLLSGKYQTPPSTSTTSALTYLAIAKENLPRRGTPVNEDEEHRMAWMLVGMVFSSLFIGARFGR